MTEKEKSYYETLKNNPKDYVFGKLFVVENGITKPIEGKWFKLMGDGIPFIYYTDLTREQNEAGVLEPPHPLELIMSFTSERTITATPVLGDSIFTFEQEAGIDSKLGNWIKKNEEKEKIEKKEREERKNRLENGVKNIKNKQNDMPGINGIPIVLYHSGYDEKTKKSMLYEAYITGGWERSIDFLSDPKNIGLDKKGLHCAVDIAYLGGTNWGVYATHDGLVSLEYGVLYLTSHPFRTVYAHMQNTQVKNGSVVKAGDLLGFIGNVATGPLHLHYEIQYNIPEIEQMENTGEYGVFSSGDIWKSINVFKYEGELTQNGQILGRVIPGRLGLSNYIGYFTKMNELLEIYIAGGASSYGVLGALYTVPRSLVLLQWLQKNRR